MRIAVLADIHGNGLALQAVLRDLARQGTFDQIIVAGDFFAPGPDTTVVFEALRQLPQARFLRGNADRYLLDKSYTEVYDGPESWVRQLRQAFQWTVERLKPAEWSFLDSLPFSQEIKTGGRSILAVHGSPRNDEEGLTADTPSPEFEQMLDQPRVNLLICGHTHVPMDRVINGIRVVNVGSVGLPFNGDPRANYAILSNLEAPAPENVSVKLHRVPYNVERAAERFYAVNHPAAALGAYNVLNGRPRGSTNIYQDQKALEKVTTQG